jgi:outer membrane receptor protein involved in Fe transport
MTKITWMLLFLSFGTMVMAQEKQRDSIRKQTLFSDTVPKKLSLTEIVVKGKKPPVSFKIDRQVFRAAEYANAANGNAIDLIKNLPAVTVNGQGEINVRGSASFQVLVNGRPTQGDPAFVLAQIPASSIESIEMISSPGASFDADGKSGVMNIITTSAPEKGLMVQSNIMLGAPPFNDFDNQRYTSPQRHAADVSIGHQKGKLEWSAGFNYLRNDMAGYREGDVNTTIGNRFTSFPSNGERSFKRYNVGGRFAAAMQLDARNRVEASVYMGKKYQTRVADLLYNISRKNLMTGQQSSFDYFNKNTAEKEGVFTLASLGSIHQLCSSTQLSLSLQYEGADLESLTTNQNLGYPGLKTMIQETINPSSNPLHAYRLKADLTDKKGSRVWQTGYQFRYDEQLGDFLYRYKNLGMQEFAKDPFFSSQVAVRNNIHAGYVQYSNAKGRLSYQAGLRAEQMLRNLSFSDNVPGNRLTLLNLFPSYLIRYALAEKVVLKQSFTRRIKRTNNFELNPYPEREHSETLEQGDPALLPELTSIWELGVEHKLSKGSFSLSLYHQRTKNPIQRVNKVYNDTILGRIFTNAGLAKQTGAEANFTYRISKAWQMMIGGNVYKYDIRGSLFTGSRPFSNNSWVYSINATQSLALKANWQLQFSVNYLSLRATAQGEDGAFFTPNFSVKKTTKDNRWSFQAQWLFMDAGLGISNIQRITTRGNNFYTTTNYIYEPDQVQLSVGFNLIKKNRKINLPQSEMAEKEF